MGILEELGLLKMDFLGLRTLTVIRDTIDMVNKLHNKQIDIDEIEMDDPGIYRLISEGNTAGIFQLESAGMTQFMKELQQLPGGYNCVFHFTGQTNGPNTGISRK